MTFLALDVGEKRIGVARSDEMNLLAHPIGYIENRSNGYVMREIQKMVEEFSVQRIVVGLPKTLKGEIGPKAKEIMAFVDKMQPSLSCPMVTWDERLTTVQAEKAMLEQDISRQKRKEKRDALAAQILLQSYLDFLEHTGEKKRHV